MVIFKEIKELRQDLKLQQLENGKKQDKIIELSKENRELKEQNKHLEEQLDRALKDYDKLLEKIGKRGKGNGK